MRTTILFLLLSINIIHGQSDLCYSANRECEKGYIGQINGIKIFYEVWNVNAGQNMHYTSLLLWTDTLKLDSIDFCFDMEKQTDSIYVTVTKTDTTYQFATLVTKQIPTLFQTLIRAEYNFDQYYRFNDPNFGQKIFIKNDMLYLTYIHSPPFEKTYNIVTETYRLVNGQFGLVKTKKKTLKN